MCVTWISSVPGSCRLKPELAERVLQHLHLHAARTEQALLAPVEVWFSPTTTFGMPYSRIAPLHMEQGESVV